jgi:glutamate 5-kinase
MPAREDLSRARRLVVKIGSRALASDGEMPRRLATEVAALRDRFQGESRFGVVLVSSGAIAIGCGRLHYETRPREMPKLQAAAAAGQSVLMRRYDEAFGAFGLTAAQILLTHSDLADRERLNNARAALAELLDAGAVPIINENDTVSTEEIRFGDNDQLAAMVTPLVQADLLVLLTDVEGVMGADGARISVMESATEIGNVENTGGVGSGGISSKLDAARKACRSGASVVIASAKRENVLSEIVSGADVGTLFPRLGDALGARKHWIAYTLRPRGALLLDAGAVKAIRDEHRSLLPVGVLGVRGQFNAGDAVSLIGPDGTEIGRGLARLGALDVSRAAGKRKSELEILFGADSDVLVVHCDDLVLTHESA